MNDDIRVAALSRYANHLENLANTAMDELKNAGLASTESQLLDQQDFIKALVIALGIVEQARDSYKIQLGDGFQISLEDYTAAMIEHSLTIKEMEKDLTGSELVFVQLAAELAKAQAEEIAKIAAKEFNVLNDIEERGVVEIEPEQLYNADNMMLTEPKFNPKNEATKILSTLYSSTRTRKITNIDA